MKIYTKTGDKGETGLFGGSRVSKADLRVEAYGTVDELNSVLAVVIEYVGQTNLPTDGLLKVQDMLFRIGSHLASMDNPKSEFLPELNPLEIERLEIEIDDLTNKLPPLKNFVLPGGCLGNAYCHVARSICRRAERRVVGLDSSLDSLAFIIKYLNRLSDYLFVLSRQLSKEQGVEERKWEA
ncbi:MAG: ATP:cob(I)alamin adenosyltransferase [Saprospirales bacterium]|nr:ATP:cob(I)alamin adenosyltransferase [Saprospirales bacterium]|tara:strand:+ start:2945 stop:3490 length:546 start_codon:yes stop_codon:yes gene_type:complete